MYWYVPPSLHTRCTHSTFELLTSHFTKVGEARQSVASCCPSASVLACFKASMRSWHNVMAHLLKWPLVDLSLGINMLLC